MTVNVQNSERTLLLILPTAKQIYAISSVALTQAQASRRELEEGYKDALLLDSDGSLRKIEHISVIGPWGKSFGRKLLSKLTGGWQISVQLSQPLTWDIEKLKIILNECITANGVMYGPEDNNEANKKLSADVLASMSVMEILDVL